MRGLSQGQHQTCYYKERLNLKELETCAEKLIFVLQFFVFCFLCNRLLSDRSWLHCLEPLQLFTCQQPPGWTMIHPATKWTSAGQVIFISDALSCPLWTWKELSVNPVSSQKKSNIKVAFKQKVVKYLCANFISICHFR